LFISTYAPVLHRIFDPQEHELLQPITAEEVDASLSSQKSSAPSTLGVSPVDLKNVKDKLISPLSSVFTWCVKNATFPNEWLESSLFFLYKKGSRSDPNNFRTINVQNPFLKCFNKILTTRLTKFAEENGLLPDEQYGFRARRSAYGAVSLLHEIIHSRLQSHQRTYVAFIDLTKAFDKIDRTLLFTKLQKMLIPYKLCETLFNIFNNIKMYLKAGDALSEPFQSNIGGPQGDVSSALLFSLFISDIVQCLPKLGPKINEVIVSVILYADDMGLIAKSAEDLQRMLDALKVY